MTSGSEPDDGSERSGPADAEGARSGGVGPGPDAAAGGADSGPGGLAGDTAAAGADDLGPGAGSGAAAEESGDPLGGLWDGERPPRRVPVPDPAAVPVPEAAAVPAAGSEPDAAAGAPVVRPGARARGRRSAPPPSGPKPRDPVRTTVRGVGQLLITAGVVVLLFVVYEIWVTNLFGDQRQAAATAQLDQLWGSDNAVVTKPGEAVVTQSNGTVVVTAPGGTGTAPDRQRHYDTTEGVGFAKMYVPSFGADFVLTVIEGTSDADLYSGPGHYQGTQYPGEPGNFSLAGHRVNKGAPFDDLGLLKSCDAIVVETKDDWYVYRVLPMQDEVAGWATAAHPHCDGVDVQTGQYSGVYGREITSPSDYAQVLPVPHVNNTVVPAGAESLITLTTCHPKFSDTQRMIIHGILVKSYPKKAGFLPPELQEED